MKSKFLTLNAKDFLKGLIIAVLTAIITFLYTSIQANNLVLDWKGMAISALTAGLAYLTKNLLTNSKDTLLSKEF